MKLPISFLIALMSCNAFASNNVTTEVVSSSQSESDHAPSSYSEMHLTGQDKALAKSFLLTNDEYKKFKYLMEYSPRKFWTPNIDPVTLLGATADTEHERLHYAQIAFKLKTERDKKQLAFFLAGIAVEQAATPNSNRWKSHDEVKFGFAETLPGSKQSLTSVFITPQNCTDNACTEFVSNILKSNSDYNKTDFYFVNATHSQISDFVIAMEISTDKITAGDITLNVENGEMKQNGLIRKLPFAISQDNVGQNIIEPKSND